MLNVGNSEAYTDFSSFAKLKAEARTDSPEAIQKVAKQFESLFLNMVMKGMREAKLGDGLLDSDQSKFYQEMYDQQLSTQLAGSPGVGLADLIVKQLSPKHDQTLEKRDITEYVKDSLASLPNGLIPEPVVTKHPKGKFSAAGLDEFAVEPLAEPAESLKIEVSENVGGISSKQQFLNQLLPLAEQAAGELGVDPKMLLAQAALETGWGNSVIKNRDGSSSYNLFNIKTGKAWSGKQATVSTLEFEQGIPKRTMAGFRAYNSYRDSFNDYVKFLKANPRYSDALKQAANPAGYIRELQQAGYATDPQYATKVLAIYHGKLFDQAPSQNTLALQ
jgi:peptidoglycan hydrolase FlgJ